MSGKMTAGKIAALLAKRHSDDVFVPECNLGSAWARCRRMDAWAMKRSWSNPLTVGYEIKVSRSDFLNDDKWHEYMKHVHEFYWVCPWGLIDAKEVGNGAGLMYVTKTGTRIIRKIKAVRRDSGFSEAVLRYVLMCRARITNGADDRFLGGREYWERWLEEKQIDYDFGSRVGKAIGERVEEEIIKARAENERLKRENAQLQNVRDVLEELGVDPRLGVSALRTRRSVERAKKAVPQELISDLEIMADRAKKAAESLAEFNTEPKKDGD